ncbi:unnamed protein product [Gongylonema pulchrum]|uniref:Glycoside hydrolase family 38 N-terminal domain-containing protein n=1 Tax=Gongylonema pulchrum TaxID=637853 RepID=A0A3P6P0M8_9BILA|nr:unnamed protein product [Gongylonema pulchrum]
MNVYVILHSHVRDIMNNMINALMKYPQLHFVWSEVSFLERWWSEANETYKKHFRRALLHSLIAEGRLEISGASWVMTDEATPYFWATIDNMVVGHQYVQQILNITPTTSWSVDPFGHGLMVPYLLSLSGIQRMVIGRVNSNIKDSLKRHQQLHFRWAQSWDPETRWAPFVNVLPNLYYTVINACGIDESVCCQFDVAKSARTPCTERAHVESPQQIAKYATRMASQYRSLQPFYNSDTILVAAGDDFSYSLPEDLEIVQRVYIALFSYINNNSKKFNMHVRRIHF